MKLQDIMTRDVVQVSPDETIEQAARRMREKSVGCLLVVVDDCIKGIITDRDLLGCLHQGHEPFQCSVATHMTRPVIVERPGEDLVTAMEVMRRNQIKRLPVIENGNLVGIVSLSDIAAAAHEEAERFWPTWVLITSFVRAQAVQGRGPRLNAQAASAAEKKAVSDGPYIHRPNPV